MSLSSKNKNNIEESKEDLQSVDDFLSQFSNKNETEVILQNVNEDDITEDVILDEKKKIRVDKMFIFAILLFLALGLAFSAAYLLNNYKFIIGYSNVENSTLSVANLSVIDSNYSLDKENLKVGDQVLYCNKYENLIYNDLRTATIIDLGSQVCIIDNGGDKNTTINYEKIRYILKSNNTVENTTE